MFEWKKYFLYARVSDPRYEESIESQFSVLENLAIRDKIDENLIIKKSEVKSWYKSGERDVFNEILKELINDAKINTRPEKRKYWWVYFFKVDRLARNDEDFTKIFDLVDKWYIFKSATETLENTPTWRLLFRLLSWFAIYESEKLSNRESITQLHNLVNERFRSLWWESIFWYYKYKKNNENSINEEENQKIKKNLKEAQIIKDIYTTFDKNKEWIFERNLTYKDIFEIIDKKHDGYLSKHMKNKNRHTPNDESLISTILKNESMTKYNWIVEREFEVKDSLFKSYVEVTKNKENNNWTLNWINLVGAKIKFFRYYQDLVIIEDSLYKKVQDYMLERKNVGSEKWEKKYNSLFEWIIFLKHDNNFYQASQYLTPKGTYQYRWIHSREKVEISEKKVEKEIIYSWYVEKILSAEQHIIEKLMEWVKMSLRIENNKDLQKLRWKMVLYKNEIEYYTYELLDESKTAKDADYNLWYKKHYEFLIKETEEEIKSIEEWSNLFIEKIIKLFSIKDFELEDEYTRRDFYLVFLDKISYNEKKEIILYPPKFLQELWFQEEINISRTFV